MTASAPDAPARSRGARTSFVDPAAPVFWVMVCLSAIGLIVQVVLNQAWLTRDLAATALAAAAWAIYGAVAIGIVLWLQRYGRRPAATVLGALAWGGLAAAGFALAGNTALLELMTKTVGSEFTEAWRRPLMTPIVEESLKAVGIIGLALIPGVRFRGALDGLFYGVLIGAGFQVVEDFLYTVNASSGDATGTIIGLVVIRGVITGLFSHAVYSGIIGAGIGYFVSRRDTPVALRILPSLAAFVLVLVLHGLWDSQDALGPTSLVLGIVTFGSFIAILLWARRDEARRLAGSGSIAVERGLMTTGELEALRADRRVTGGRPAKRRRLAQLRYLEAVEELGPDDPRAGALAQEVPAIGGPS